MMPERRLYPWDTVVRFGSKLAKTPQARTQLHSSLFFYCSYLAVSDLTERTFFIRGGGGVHVHPMHPPPPPLRTRLHRWINVLRHTDPREYEDHSGYA